MASGEGAPGHGWVREGEVRATLSAIEGELALAMRPPRRLAASRLLRLRVVLLAVKSSDLPLEDALRSLRAALRGRHRRLHDPAPEAGGWLLGGPCRGVVALLTLAARGVWPGPLVGHPARALVAAVCSQDAHMRSGTSPLGTPQGGEWPVASGTVTVVRWPDGRSHRDQRHRARLAHSPPLARPIPSG
jgi:hypothetical protein